MSMEKIYPANLLIKCFALYDPSMNRLDPWMDVMQQKRNKKHIKHAITVNPLILDVLSLSLDQLDERRKDILLLRYRDGRTLQECGEKYHISAERARQLSETAIRHIQEQEQTPFFSLIWPENNPLSSDEWLTWLLTHVKEDTKRFIPYASVPVEGKRVLITKVDKNAKEVYEKAVERE